MRYRPLGGGGGSGSITPTTAVPLTFVLADGEIPGSIKVADSILPDDLPTLDAQGPGSVNLQMFWQSASQGATGAYSVIAGGNSNTASASQCVVVGGEANNATGNFSTVCGGSYNTASKTNSSIGGGFTNTASGVESYVGGGGDNTASGANSVVAGGDTNKASNVSSGVCAGVTNTASGIFSFVGGGGGNTASSTYGTIGGGQNNVASGQGATVSGGSDNQTTALYSWCPGGWQTRNPLYGAGAWSGGQFAAAGDCQVMEVHARIATTNATPTTLLLDNASRRILIPSGYIWFFTARVGGVKDDGAKAGFYIRQGVIANVGGTTALIGAIQTVGVDIETDAGLDVTITADNTNDALDVSVTGLAATNMRWTCHIELQQIKYS